MKVKFKSRYILLLGALAWLLWLRLKPDTFFADLSLDVPTEYIISHRSPFWLRAVEDRLILKIPGAEVAAVKKVFASQKRYEDVTPHLPRHYREFVSGLEKFFPRRPKSFQAGRFHAFDRNRHIYACKFLFDQDDPNFTYLYLDSVSPID